MRETVVSADRWFYGRVPLAGPVCVHSERPRRTTSGSMGPGPRAGGPGAQGWGSRGPGLGVQGPGARGLGSRGPGPGAGGCWIHASSMGPSLLHARGQDREGHTRELSSPSSSSGPSQATGTATETASEPSATPAESATSASGTAAPTPHAAPAAAVPSRATGRTAGAPKSSYDRADCVGAPLPSDLCKLTPASNPSTHTASCLSVCCSCAQVAWAIEDGSQEPGATQSSSCAAFFANLCSFGKITHVPNPSPLSLACTQL